MLLVGGTASNIRTYAWSDKYCKTFTSDGLSCLECAFHSYMDKDGCCKPVSDWCKDWDPKTGCCLCCFEGYGNPVNGVCSNKPVK